MNRGALLDQLRAALVTEVTEDSRWAPLIGQHITDVTVYWEDVPTPNLGDGTRYPQDIALTFELGARVFLSAAIYEDSSHTLFRMSDNVVVVFDELFAQCLRVGPFERPE
ncbi:hypothetical protein Dalu01_00809 [Deinococcus aluminii]|uniref:Uncharacterized protein n=1 Tax=Deinococcus aluminii TaxID=1656885 RepID=A0ABP9XD03_9DEIO